MLRATWLTGVVDWPLSPLFFPVRLARDFMVRLPLPVQRFRHSRIRAGFRVCAVFYGHPGVFVYPSHEAIRRARAEGFAARMLPALTPKARNAPHGKIENR